MRYQRLWLRWLLLLLVVPCLALRMREPPPPIPVSRVTPDERWLRVKLNQFVASDTRTFLMRFYYNDEFAEENAVITIGGEWEISSGWAMGGLAYDIAKQLRAGMFYTEHRYYGKTRPFDNTRLSSLQYLSVHQALADLAQFIHYIKSDAFEGGQYKSGRVVVVGCSYAGSMATWMRQTYPHLVDAAFSDSGPVLAQEAYPEYMTIVIKAIRERGGEACLDSISEGMKQLVKMLATIAKAKELSKMFNTCTPVQSSPPQDMTAFLEKIEDSFNELVQKSKNIPAACAVLTNASVSSPVRRLANYITSWSSKPCVDIRYTGRAPDYMNTSYDSENYAARLWMYQTCVEFGWYPISTSAHEPYFPRVPLEYYLQHCKDYFSEDFNEEQLRRGVQQTNIMFGGLKHRPDHLISVSGTHDPWSALAPNSSHARRNSPVYVIPGVAHCKAIRGPENGDSRELRNARRVVVNFMHNNIHRPIPLSDATYIQVTPVLLGLALVVLY